MEHAITFAPLEVTESLKRRNQTLAQRPVSARRTRRIMIVFLPLFFVGGLVLLVVVTLVLSLMGPLALIALPAGALFLFRFLRQREKRMRNALGEFIQANQWLEGGKLPASQLVLDPNMKSLSGCAAMHGTLDGMPFWLHKVTQADFQSGPTNAKNLVMTIQLPSSVPTMFISSLNQLLGLNLKGTFVNQLNLVPLQLEGDFDEYLQLYAPPSQRIEALAYMTPDVMEVLRDNCWTLCVEYTGNYINLWCPEVELTYTPLRQLLTGAQLLIQEHTEKVSKS